MEWFKPKKKCKLCDKKLAEENPQLKLDTADGVLILDICNSCADSLEEIQQKMTAAAKRLADG